MRIATTRRHGTNLLLLLCCFFGESRVSRRKKNVMGEEAHEVPI